MHSRGAGVPSGWAALRLAGGAFFDGLEADGRTRRPVMLVTGPGQRRRPRPGIRWSQDRLEVADTWLRQGIRCTRPDRAVFDEMRTAANLPAAVRTMDMAAAAELTSIRRVGTYLEEHPGWDGIVLAQRALTLASERSRSPRETDFRLVWALEVRAGPVVVNRCVFDQAGNLLGIADLLDPRAGVVGEYDGDDHAGPWRRSKDSDRDSAFRAMDSRPSA